MVIDSVTDITAHHYLVIDDDVVTTSLITHTLHDIGATMLDNADDGEVARRHISKTGKQPDIIICALPTPNMDGVAFMRHLADEEFTGGVILLSSETGRILRIAVDLAEAHHLNVLGSLPKPFAASALLDMISHFDGLKKMPSALPASFVTQEALSTAIRQHQILPFFQTKISVKTGKVIGVEALARWQHPERGLVPPDLFIPVAEAHGLIGLLTQEIVSKTLQHAAAWRKAGLALPFSINLAAMSLSDVDLPDQIAKELHKTGIDPSSVTLEITESGGCKNMTLCLDTLLRLHLKGIHLSIDDFGTDHSTLEQLHKMPFSELKIDRLFVTGATQNDEARVFFQSAVMLAKKLGLITVAEGVETQDDLDLCTELGCDVAQGYFFSRPVQGETFLKAA